MLIVADENIPYAREAFVRLGEMRLMPGREMTAAAVREADVLFVRSVTLVNQELLRGSRVRFVGTATIGTDHIDLEYLRQAGVAFSAAPGSNANSVAEYVAAALLLVAQRQDRLPANRSIGIIGVGNVGSRVAANVEALGMRALLNDPPLERTTGDPRYLPLDDLFACDFITLHVPLEKHGADPTYHMVDAAFLAKMRSDAVLLNTSRGAVVDNAALLAALEAGELAGTVLDVWEGEPEINPALLNRAMLGTPHIAGYSLDGKANGTEMIYRAACQALDIEPEWDAGQSMPPPQIPELLINASDRPIEEILREAVLRIYPIENDDAPLRIINELPANERAAGFDRLRKEYPTRREFQNTAIKLVGGLGRRGGNEALAEKLRTLGFRIA